MLDKQRHRFPASALRGRHERRRPPVIPAVYLGDAARDQRAADADWKSAGCRSAPRMTRRCAGMRSRDARPPAITPATKSSSGHGTKSRVTMFWSRVTRTRHVLLPILPIMLPYYLFYYLCYLFWSRPVTRDQNVTWTNFSWPVLMRSRDARPLAAPADAGGGKREIETGVEKILHRREVGVALMHCRNIASCASSVFVIVRKTVISAVQRSASACR